MVYRVSASRLTPQVSQMALAKSLLECMRYNTNFMLFHSFFSVCRCIAKAMLYT